MRWIVFLIHACVFVALDFSLMNVLQIRALSGIRPLLVGSLVSFVCLFAPKRTALWAAWILGMLTDASMQFANPNGPDVVVLGPHALGFVFGGYFVIQLRTMVFRHRALSFAFLTFIVLLTASLVTVMIYVMRSWQGAMIVYPTSPSAVRALFESIGTAVYSALFAIPLGWLLLQTMGIWNFQQFTARSPNYR